MLAALGAGPRVARAVRLGGRDAVVYRAPLRWWIRGVRCGAPQVQKAVVCTHLHSDQCSISKQTPNLFVGGLPFVTPPSLAHRPSPTVLPHSLTLARLPELHPFRSAFVSVPDHWEAAIHAAPLVSTFGTVWQGAVVTGNVGLLWHPRPHPKHLATTR